MTGKLGVGEDSMTTMVMCARTPFFLTTGGSGGVEVAEAEAKRQAEEAAVAEPDADELRRLRMTRFG